ncbi:MAG: hypothetical protein QNJ98_04175 [Planctomycetota bacterium]|nr:hypothetical protein [Planctomycetota bacterium]
MSARSPANDELKQALRQAEARLAEGLPLTEAQLESLQTLTAAAAPLPVRLSRRSAQVIATHALRTRQEPAGALEGFYEAVSAATVDEPFSRARVSNAYLDAPRSLATWRRTAAAACVLAAIATGFALTADGPAPVRPASQVERYSLLDGVLERYDPAAEGRLPAPVGAPLDIYEVGGPQDLGVPSSLPPRITHPRPLLIYGARARVRIQGVFRARGGIGAEPSPVEVEKN